MRANYLEELESKEKRYFERTLEVMAVGDWYRWHWAKWPRDTWPTTKREIRKHPASRKGQRCRLLAVGMMNSAAIEFEDGARFITSRRGLRKLQPAERHGNTDIYVVERV